ncbi:MAG: hypothetical protein ACTSUE_10395 [Promethearchaeota archaeon]
MNGVIIILISIRIDSSTINMDDDGVNGENAAPGGRKRPRVKGMKADWSGFESKVRDLKERINRDILRNIERWEDLRYKNKVRASKLRKRIEADWNAMGTEVQYAVKRAKESGDAKRRAMAETLNARKAEVDAKLKAWREKQKEKFQVAVKRWERRSWIFFIKFLLVVIPIVIIIVVLANAFN